MSRKVKRATDKLLSFIALCSVTVVPVLYVCGIASMHAKLDALEESLTGTDGLISAYEELVDVGEQLDELHNELSGIKEQLNRLQAATTGSEYTDLAEPVVPVAVGEEELLIRLVIAESGNQPYEGQVAVAQVVCDRYVAGYGDSITDVIYAKNQFAKPYSKDISDYPLASEAVHAVLYEGERAFTETTLFFCNPGKSSTSALEWMRTKSYIGTIADHEFYGE